EVREVLLAAVARMRSKDGEPIVRATMATAVEPFLPSGTPDLYRMPELLRAAGAAAGVSLRWRPTGPESRDTGGGQKHGETLEAPMTPGSAASGDAEPKVSRAGEPGLTTNRGGALEAGAKATIPPVKRQVDSAPPRERPGVSATPPVRRQGGPTARRPGPTAPPV